MNLETKSVDYILLMNIKYLAHLRSNLNEYWKTVKEYCKLAEQIWENGIYKMIYELVLQQENAMNTIKTIIKFSFMTSDVNCLSQCSKEISIILRRYIREFVE